MFDHNVWLVSKCKNTNIYKTMYNILNCSINSKSKFTYFETAITVYVNLIKITFGFSIMLQ